MLKAVGLFELFNELVDLIGVSSLGKAHNFSIQLLQLRVLLVCTAKAVVGHLAGVGGRGVRSWLMVPSSNDGRIGGVSRVRWCIFRFRFRSRQRTCICKAMLGCTGLQAREKSKTMRQEFRLFSVMTQLEAQIEQHNKANLLIDHLSESTLSYKVRSWQLL